MTTETPGRRRRFGFDAGTGTMHLMGRSMRTPRSRPARIALGIFLILGGIFSFLPVLGIWMLPLGLLVLSQDSPMIRRWRRSSTLYFARRRQKRRSEID